MSIFSKKSLLLSAALGCVLCSWFALSWYRFAVAPMLAQGSTPQTVFLPAGKGAHYLFETLTSQQLFRYPHSWQFFAYWCVDTLHLQAGEYEVTDQISFRTLLQHIATGQVMLRPFTMIEGWTVARVSDALARNPYLEHATQNMTEAQLLTALQSSASALEGLLFPDTYLYTRGQNDLVLITKAYQKMQRVLQEAWDARAPDTLFQTPYEALIAASLIERETALPAERPLVAAVIVNRLKRGMRLQLDPSVRYGLALQRGQPLTHADLSVPTPYNTYLNLGLPPTPIALVSKDSLQAALHPAAVDYLYFVADGKGGHQFTSNYAAHRVALKRYRQQQQLHTLDTRDNDQQCNLRPVISSH